MENDQEETKKEIAELKATVLENTQKYEELENKLDQIIEILDGFTGVRDLGFYQERQ